MVAAYLSTDESLADLRCGVLDTGCNNTCYTGSGLRGLFNRSMGAPIQGASGISKPGTKGDSYVYFCSADPNQQGTVHLVKGQSVESFPRDLISTDQFTHGGEYRFAYDKADTFKGLRNTSGDWIPGYRNPTTRLLECAFVMGVNQNEVLIKGRQYDSILQNTSALQLKRAGSRPISSATYAKLCLLIDRTVECTCAPGSKRCRCDDGSEGANEAAVTALFADDPDGAVIKGIRRGLRAHTRKLTHDELHAQLGHIGDSPNCTICQAVKASLRRYNTKMRNDTSERRAGYRWYGDTITWDTPSRYGYRYSAVLVDAATGYFLIFHLRTKDETAGKLIALIKSMRLNPYFSFNNHGHTFFTELRLDEAGEWSSTNKEFLVQLREELGCNAEWCCGFDKRDAANAENAVKQVEIRAKSIMLESNLPRSWWLEATNHGAFLDNLTPRNRMIKSSDGDAVRPLQLLTNHAVSQQQCNDMLSASLLPGTLCMVNKKHVKGNSTANMERPEPGVVLRMRGKAIVFEDPARQGTIFASKNYKVIKLIPGLSPWRALNLPEPDMPKRRLVKNIDGGGDADILTSVVCLDIVDSLGERKRLAIAAVDTRREELDEASKPKLITFMDQDNLILEPDEHGNYVPTGDAFKRVKATEIEGINDRVPERIRRLREKPESFVGEPIYKYFARIADDADEDFDYTDFPSGVYEGIVIGYSKPVADDDVPLWDIRYDIDEATEQFDEEQMIYHCLDRLDGMPGDPTHRHRSEESSDDGSEGDPDTCGTWKDCFTAPNRVYTTRNKDTFHHILAGLNLNETVDGRAYYQWIRTFGTYGHTHSKQNGGLRFPNPFGNSNASKKLKFDEGVPFPYPVGTEWESISRDHDEMALFALSARNTEYEADHDADALLAMEYSNQQYRCAIHKWITKPDFNFKETVSLLAEGVRDAEARRESARTSNVDPEILDPATGKIKIPRTFGEALRRSDKAWWIKAWQKEADALDAKAVIQHNLTADDLRALGVDPDKTPPIPMGVILDIKYGVDGELEKYKCRNCIKGHPGNVTRGVHYTETFSAAPDMISSRMIGVIAMRNKMKRIAWDVNTAYLNSECAPSERVPLRYPPEFREYRTDENGKKHEIYGLLLRNLYGHPAAARNWGKTRDTWILKTFNDNGYTCVQCASDECVFTIKRNTGEHFIMIIHTDDVDGYTTSHQFGLDIANLFDKEWGIRMCDPSQMLGVRRDRWTDDKGVEHLKLSMPSYVDDLYQKWKSCMSDTTEPNTAFPPGQQNSFHEWVDKLSYERNFDMDEVKRVQDRGFLSVTGSLLWAGRCVFLETSYGINQLCKIMSKPVEKNWDQAMHILRWMYKNKDQGIEYSSQGNQKLTAFYDSSFNPDPKDSKCHYGWVIYLCGGPIAWGSHKHNHVSPAVMHAEYCTVRPLGDCIIWMRKLCTELGFSEFCDEPVPTHGDNDMATGLIRENRHTPANRMILREFHLVQQYCRDGYIDPLRVNTKRNPSDLLTKAVTEVDWNRTIDELRGLSPIDYVTLASDPDSASLSIELSPSSLLAVKDCPPSFANAVKGLPDTEMSISRFMYNLLNSSDD